jgi:hypothetical protein
MISDAFLYPPPARYGKFDATSYGFLLGGRHKRSAHLAYADAAAFVFTIVSKPPSAWIFWCCSGSGKVAR